MLALALSAPVEVEDLSKHKMDSLNTFRWIKQAADSCQQSRKLAKKNICAVGTTAMRAMETAVSADGLIETQTPDGRINLSFTHPTISALPISMVTNFHMPESSIAHDDLLLLAAMNS
jgi:S-adenosylmethionine:tRNA ribosyltransferase-isomerase